MEILAGGIQGVCVLGDPVLVLNRYLDPPPPPLTKSCILPWPVTTTPAEVLNWFKFYLLEFV